MTLGVVTDQFYIFSSLTRRGQMEKSSITRDLPIAKAAYSYLHDNVSSLFSFPGWNKGRIVCQRSQLKRILSGAEPSSDASKVDNIITLSNAPFQQRGSRTFPSNIKSQLSDASSEISNRTITELITTTV